ncbi:MAG TPA: hypothetical protein IAC79_06085 [Candidatus Spyradenecus faecavium]|uniref:Uncharacterized protein n=1 Tax=Candidatus Spyradenecus faecavium TaxID=2840947 RepID=A0A9D1NN28_9BACT|nr:hypothetical protein [Candidatus Spyradenecus faecavium]
MTKTLKFLTALAALTLASPAWAQGTIPEVTFAKVETTAQSGQIEVVDGSAPFAYADGTTMLPGEEVAAVYVVTQPNVTLSADSEIPFEVAVDGTILPDETVVDRIVWPALGNVAATSRSMTIDEAGALWATRWSKYSPIEGMTVLTRGFPCYWPQGESTALEKGQRIALYLIVFDSRAYGVDGTVAVSVPNVEDTQGPACVSAWGATLVTVSSSIPNSGVLSPCFVNIGEDAGTFLGILYENAPLLPPVALTRAPALPASLTVNGETLADVAAIEDALTPAVSGLAASTLPGGTAGLTLTLAPPAAPGLMAYDLWTTDTLGGTWVRFDAFLQQKGLATSSGMRYTRLRIDGVESLQIPQVEGETTRFYQLRAAGSETGEQK